MEKFISDDVYVFNIDCIIDPYAPYIAASELHGIHIPDGELMSGIRGDIPSEQMVADYEDFIEAVEDLLQDYYGLILVYKSKSVDYSKYYNFLACDESGNALFRIRLRLRISNHNPRRSKESQKHKKEEKESEKLLNLLNGRPMPKAYPKSIIVNSTEFNSYEEAFKYIDSEVVRWIDVMTK